MDLISGAGFGKPFVQSSGDILVPGSIDGHPVVVRYHGDGTLDRSFGNGGVATVIVPNSDRGAVGRIDIQANGRIVANGVVRILDTFTPILVRFSAKGTLDPTFGEGGIFLLPTTAGTDAWMNGAVVRSDGIIVAVRQLRYAPLDGSPRSSVLFFTSDGRLDPAFGEGGVVTLGGPPQTALTDIVRLDDDAVVVSGVVDDVGNIFVGKLRNDGTPEPAFGDAGVQITKTRRYEAGWSIGVDSLGRILVAGDRENKSIFVRRYLPDGKLDATYGRGGRASLRFASSLSVGSFAVTPEGYAIVPAYFIPGPGIGRRGSVIARFGIDGKRDRSFGRNGIQKTKLDPYGLPLDVAGPYLSVQPDGKLLATIQSYIADQTYFAPVLLRFQGGVWDGTSQCVVGCGNGVVTPPEQCDDGNVLNGDGCSAACMVE